MLGLAEGRAVLRTFKDLAIEVNSSFKPGRMVWSFPNAGIRGKIEATSLRQLLKLVLVHFYSDSFSAPPHFFPSVHKLTSSSLLRWAFHRNQNPSPDPIRRNLSNNQNYSRIISPSSVTEIKTRRDQRFLGVFSPSLSEREERERRERESPEASS